MGSPFVGFFREVLDIRYLWRVPLRLNNSKLVSQIGPEPHPPLDAAVRQTLSDLGCLSACIDTQGIKARAFPQLGTK
jgi:hypothetical protein